MNNFIKGITELMEQGISLRTLVKMTKDVYYKTKVETEDGGIIDGK